MLLLKYSARFGAGGERLAFQLKGEIENLFLVLVRPFRKTIDFVMIAENLVAEKGLNAGAVVREAAKEMQGGGGGQAFYATAGGKDLSGLSLPLKKQKRL